MPHNNGFCPNWYYYCQTAANFNSLYGPANFNYFLEVDTGNTAGATWYYNGAWISQIGRDSATSTAYQGGYWESEIRRETAEQTLGLAVSCNPRR